MGARRIVLAALAAVLLLAACAPARQPPPRVALLAPFEGRYREIGYDVLYALRLGLADSGSDVIVNAVDISREADLRASAVASDPAILAVIAAGPQLSDTAVLGALHGIPTIVLGDWDAPHDPAIFFMAPSQTSTIPAVVALDTYHWDDDDARGGDVFALREFARLNPNADPEVIISAALPDEALSQRIQASGLFVPEPRLHASLAYDAGLFLGGALTGVHTRTDALDAVSRHETTGYNGTLAFDHGWWRNAPIRRYRVSGEMLTPVD